MDVTMETQRLMRLRLRSALSAGRGCPGPLQRCPTHAGAQGSPGAGGAGVPGGVPLPVPARLSPDQAGWVVGGGCPAGPRTSPERFAMLSEQEMFSSRG